MVKKLETEIVINLTGDLARKARLYGASMADLAKKSSIATTMMRRSAEVAGRGIDSVGNRYVGVAAAIVTGAATTQFANLDRRLSRVAIAADITTDKAKELYEQIRQISNEEGIRIDPKEALSAVEEILTKTGDLEYAIKNLPNLAAVIQATGASGQNIGGIFTELKKLGISSSEEAMKAIDTLNMQGKSGAFTLASLANYGPQIFAAYAATGRKGADAVTELGAALQVIRDGSGSDAEAVTAFTSLIRDITDPDRVKTLKQLGGINVFDPEKLKNGIEEMRPLSELMTEITIRSKGLSESIDMLNLSDEATRALNPLIAAYKQFGDVNVFDKFMNIKVDGTATLKDAKIAANDLAASLQRINNEIERASNSVFAGPFKEIADAINGVDQETIDNWLKWASVAVIALGAVAAAKKTYDIYSWGKNTFGGNGKEKAGGAGVADMNVTRVFVVNMPYGFGGSRAGDIKEPSGGDKGDSKSKPSRLGSAVKGLAAAAAVYQVYDVYADAFNARNDAVVNFVKNTNLADLIPSFFGSDEIKDVTSNPNSATSSISTFSGINGQLNLKLDLTDNRSKLTVVNRPPFISVDPDTGVN